MIPTRVHAPIDYAFAAALPAAIRRSRAPRPVRRLADAAALAAVGYATATRYELGVVRLIPMRRHLALDALLGGLLLGAAATARAPAAARGVIAAFGALSLAAAALTDRTSATERRPRRKAEERPAARAVVAPSTPVTESARMTAVDLQTSRLVLVAGLRNQHAVERQALELMNRQVERLQHYPDLEARMRQHIRETEVQRDRIEEILTDLNETTSSLKDAAMMLAGNAAALFHAPAKDEILKNTFANFAFENYEIASYKSLITVAESAGSTKHLPLLQASLSEEQAMAQWIDDHVRETTLTYLEREARDETAKH
jgi:ferritin-like metal-binding protein YciE